MAEIGEDVAAHCVELLADKAMHELKYLCCYKSCVDEFEEDKKILEERKETIEKDIEEARNRIESLIESDVKRWREEADGLIKEDTKGKEKWFGLVTNCIWQYNRGKKLEEKKRRIQKLLGQSNEFRRVARPTPPLGIKFYSNDNFMQLKDRKLQFEALAEALKNALKNDNKFVIGLYGLGGTGKTTLAIEVGVKVAESKVFDKVIFSVVSKDANLKQIRDNIAQQLNLTLKEGALQAQELCKGIAEGGEKVLIILDDVWEELSLKDIGIPLGRHGKSCCSMLLTTRDRRVCNNMGCPEPIELEVLSEKDAVELFLSYADKSTDSSSNDFKGVAFGIVKECGRLPVAVVAVARALRYKPLKEWKQGLERLRNPKSMHAVNEDLEKAYKSLRLSYDYLKNEQAKQLFLLCSLFPDDYEIPIELLTRIAIGVGLCGRVDKYSVARSHFTPIKNVLMDSCLLLKAENDAVKMHDLVREVALWIGNEVVQVVMDSGTTLMENIQYSSWNTDDFPSRFAGRNLKALLLSISNDARVKVRDGIFEGMENLKFLALTSWSDISTSGASLFQSRPLLTNVRSLAIIGSRLGDISFLVNLKCLESLELNNCSMIELPKGISELERLRLLEIVHCAIERNNALEVIGSCRRLEELYFISQHKDKGKSLAQIATFPKLERYHIKGWRHSKVDFSVSRCFDSRYLKANFSDEIFKSLVARAEVLKLGSYYSDKGWTNVVPDILPVKDDNMEDNLIRLRLKYINGMKCLICTECLQSGVALFSKLVKLELHEMDVRELCCGPYPVNFLKQLEKLELFCCDNLKSSLFDGKLELCNLKSIDLFRCSMVSLFHPFTAQSLKQLEELEIKHCFGLKYIVAQPVEDHDPNEMSHDSMFPKLKDLSVCYCAEIEFILPICFCKDLPLLESMEIIDCKKLEYIFGLYPNERDLHQMGKEAILQSLEGLEISQVPNFVNLYVECYLPCPGSDEEQKSSLNTNVEDCTSNLSRGHLCCFWSKSNASTIHHPSTSMNHNEAMKVNYVVNRAHGLFTAPLYPYERLRSLEIAKLVGLKSLFTLSIASSLKLLEILMVNYCDTLEHIVTDKEDDHEDVNPIFPTLQTVIVRGCSDLEYLFPAFYSKEFKDLEYVSVANAEKLTHIFGKCQADDQNHNVHIDLNLPALKRLHLSGIPNIVSICAQNYSMKELYLEYISLDRSPQLPSETLIEVLPPEEKGKPLYNLQELPEFKKPKSYISFQNLSALTIKGCKQLKFIFSESTSRRLIKLRTLEVFACEELVSIIEDQENNKNPTARHQVLFPELRTIAVWNCKSMEYLFSISSAEEELYKLKQSFERNPVHEVEDARYVRLTIFKWKIERDCMSEEVSKEIAEEDSTTNSNLPNLTKSTKTSANEIVEEKLSTTPSFDLDMNLKATFGEGPSSEKYGKASSSKESMDDDQQAHGESRSSNEVPQRIEEPTKEWSSKETSNEVLLKIPPPSVTEMTYALPPTAISTAHTEPKSPQSDMFDISINTEGPQVEIMTNDETCTDVGEMKFDHKSSSQIFEEHDLMRLFQMMKEGADMEVDLSYVSKLIVDLHDNKEVTKALADLEASLKKGLNEIACSEESRLRLQNALNILCSHCSEDGASSHGLQDTIQSLQQEIQTVLSSFNQAYATIDTFTKLEQKEKLMIEQRSQREKDAKTLLYDINTTKNSIAKVQLNEAELKEKISKLQVELRSKEEEIEEYKKKLLSLQEQEKKSVSDTIGFTMEFLAMEKERSCMMEDQMKARQQLKNMEAKWSSCLSNLKKTMMLLGVHLKQKL
ncbi:hypothetical protein K1719_023303 [Acacia pycnantha]|nr:hypothetical protein K1719_023303 [Acacia pycnantha]